MSSVRVEQRLHNAYLGRRRTWDMVDLTLLRVDVDVESVAANATAYAPFAKSAGGDSDDEDGDAKSDASIDVEGSGGGGRVKVGLAAALVGLLFLVVAGVILRKYVTEGDEEGEGIETA